MIVAERVTEWVAERVQRGGDVSWYTDWCEAAFGEMFDGSPPRPQFALCLRRW